MLIGFAVVGSVIGLGYLLGRLGILGPGAQFTISRLVFFVLTPALLFTVTYEADVHTLFSVPLLVAAISAVSAGLVYLVVIRFFGPRSVPRLVVGTLASGYQNANNIGLPIAVFVLGGPDYVVPVILLQILVFAPIALTILDASTRGAVSIADVLLQPVRNPLIIASVVGVLLNLFRVPIPADVLAPFELVGAAMVPLVLISFGMSLHGERALKPGPERVDVLVASAVKLAVMPLVAYLVARFLFGIEGHALFALVVVAAFPTAQNVFNYAERYDRSVILARDAVLLTTVLAIPVLVVVAVLLA
ncbi:AEC family transporter [soil metagenome]